MFGVYQVASKDEAKKLRPVIQVCQSYIHLEADYLLRIRRIESETLSEWKHLAASLKIQLSRAQTPEEKAKYENLLNAQEYIKQFIEAGVKEVKELKEVDWFLSMTKKEIAALMDEIRSMANKIEQQNQTKVTSKKKRKK